MISFTDVLLSESLTSVAPFYMTDDTQIPNRITAAFKIEDTDYVFLLEKFLSEGLYKIEIIQMAGKTKRYWKFKNANHIRIAFSTAIKAFEASIPFLGTQIKGIAMPIPSSIESNYIKLCKLLISKTYLKNQFDYLPIDHTKSKFQYLMMIRKGQSPKNIFTAKYFKDYDFSEFDFGTVSSSTPNAPAKKGVKLVPGAAIEKIKPIIQEKSTYTLDPSKKFSFNGFEYNAVTDQAVSAVNMTHAKVDLLNKPKTDDNAEKIKQQHHDDIEMAVTKYHMALSDKIGTSSKFAFHETKNNDALIKKCQTLIALAFPDVCAPISTFSVSPSTVKTFYADILKSHANKNNYSYVAHLTKIVPHVTHTPDGYDMAKSKDSADMAAGTIGIAMANAVNELKKLGFFDLGSIMSTKTYQINNSTLSYPEITEIFKWAVWRYHQYVKVDYESFKPAKTEVKSKFSWETVHKHEKADDFSINELPVNSIQEKLIASMNSDTENYADDGGYKVAAHLQSTAAYKSIDKLKAAQFSAVKSYTGSGFSGVNSTLRKALAGKANTGSELVSYIKKANNLRKAFNDIVPLEEGIWVFRNTSVPGISVPDKTFEIGEVISDAAFLSTSLKPHVFSGGNTRFIIYLPPGSKVIPILNKSNHPGEQEVILPALSALKVVEVYAKSSTQYVKCIYLGTGMNDIMDKKLMPKLKKTDLELEESNFMSFREFINEAKKPSKEDPNSKFAPGADELGNTDELRKNAKLMTSGKIKMEKVPTPKKVKK